MNPIRTPLFAAERTGRFYVRSLVRIMITAFLLAVSCASAVAQDPLPSWNDGATKQAILGFVRDVTGDGSKDFVSPDDRVATFDNDGTLWVEQPMYTQLAFAIDRVRLLAGTHPEWKTQQPFKAVLEGDLKALAKFGNRGLLEIILATHAGMTTDEFQKVVTDWLAASRHPRFHQPYTALVYQPMLELIAYLRVNGFRTYIVSGGGVEFMRPWTQKVYRIPPREVIGSSIKTKFEERDKQPILMRLPEVDFIDDGPGKPVGIHQYIAQRPIIAFGNSDGDLQMLEWTTQANGRTLGLLLHHTDPYREYAYDRNSDFGRLDIALNMARDNHWVVVDMKNDWKTVFSFKP